jgi:hypothetical protein
MEKMAGKIAGAEFVRLDGLGHFGWAEAPDRFNASRAGLPGTALHPLTLKRLPRKRPLSPPTRRNLMTLIHEH